jgi:hypothetical protein
MAAPLTPMAACETVLIEGSSYRMKDRIES